MDEAVFRREIEKLCADRGWWYHHPPDDTPVVTDKQINEIIQAFKLQQVPDVFKRIRQILVPPTWKRETITPARPDIYNLGPMQRTVIVECKVITPLKIKEPYLNPADISDGQRRWLDAWKFQSGGLAYLAVGLVDVSPRRAWLVPWDWYALLEKRLAEQAIDFKVPISMFSDEFELLWVKGAEPKYGPWQLREEHPLVPFCMPECSPNLVVWDKQYSLRFTKKKEE
jgi:hypothetical protein